MPICRYNSKMRLLRFYLLWALLLLLATSAKLQFNHPFVNLILWTCVTILVIFYARIFKAELLSSLRPNPTGPLVLALIALAGGLTYVLIINYFKMLGFTHYPTPQTHQNLLAHSWPTWSSYLLIAVIPVTLEEISFRSLIYGYLERSHSSTIANLIQATLYALLHLRPAMILSHFILGLFFGLCRQKTGSLYLGLLIHILWNSWAIYNAGKAFP